MASRPIDAGSATTVISVTAPVQPATLFWPVCVYPSWASRLSNKVGAKEFTFGTSLQTTVVAPAVQAGGVLRSTPRFVSTGPRLPNPEMNGGTETTLDVPL